MKVLECNFDELSAQEQGLVAAAKNAVHTSYSPYSHFRVGAAVLMDNGEVVTGSNQENAAFPSGTCAERTAVFYASARYPEVPVRKIAIAAWTAAGKQPGLPSEDYFTNVPISPCGSCRQALLEYETRFGDIKVILYGREKIYVFPSISSLLPYCFNEL